MTRQADSRALALEVLYEINEKGAYANLALDRALFSCREADARDRALATELVYGTVKQRGRLDYILDQFATVKTEKMDPWTRNNLRLALYQLTSLDKIPPSAAVDEAVKLAKRHGHADKFVNAVLRAYLRGKDQIRWPDPAQSPAEYLAARYSFPRWMTERFLRAYGPEQAEALCRWYNAPAPLWIRTNTLRTSRAALRAQLEQAGFSAAESRIAPEGLRLDAATDLRGLDAFRRGLFTVQDESSMLAARAVSPTPGDSVLDVCSAPGGKTTHLAQLMQNTGRICACDIHPHRLELVRETCARLGVTCVELFLQDGTRLRERWQTPFDAVLCDVPCSGLGVLGRRADARWSKTAADIDDLCRVQAQILEEAAQLVKPGGVLVYSTCTITPEENELQVRRFLERHCEFSPDPLLSERCRCPEKGGAGMVQFLPFADDMDGFFIARLLRRS